MEENILHFLIFFFRIYNGVKMQHILLHTEYDPGRENEELGGEEP